MYIKQSADRTLNDQHKASQDKRHKMRRLVRDKPHNVWGNPLIKSSFIFKVQQRKREREIVQLQQKSTL